MGRDEQRPPTRGVVFIDGSMVANNGNRNTYNGQGTIYLWARSCSTTTTCAASSGSACDFSAGTRTRSCSRSSPTATAARCRRGIRLRIDNGAKIQGALRDERDRHHEQRRPTATSSARRSRSARTSPATTSGRSLTVPPGMPGGPEVYAQPNPPQGSRREPRARSGPDSRRASCWARSGRRRGAQLAAPVGRLAGSACMSCGAGLRGATTCRWCRGCSCEDAAVTAMRRIRGATRRRARHGRSSPPACSSSA